MNSKILLAITLIAGLLAPVAPAISATPPDDASPSGGNCFVLLDTSGGLRYINLSWAVYIFLEKGGDKVGIAQKSGYIEITYIDAANARIGFNELMKKVAKCSKVVK